MELIMHTDLSTAVPQVIDFNFEAIKNELTDKLTKYNNLVVTEDSIKDAKADRANLNKLKEALETKRKEVKKEVMAPYTAFEAKIKELVSLIDQPIQRIDGQVKAYDDIRKEEKQKEIEAHYLGIVPGELQDIIPFERVMKPQWLNVTMTMPKIKEELENVASRVKLDMMVIDTIEPEYQDAVKAEYVSTLNVELALLKKKQLQDAKEAFKKREEAKAMQEPAVPQKPQEEPKTAPQQDDGKIFKLCLELNLTKAQAEALKAYLVVNNIDHRKINKEEMK